MKGGNCSAVWDIVILRNEGSAFHPEKADPSFLLRNLPSIKLNQGKSHGSCLFVQVL
jgi:hypothetical protein